jgi:hypothetical protein
VAVVEGTLVNFGQVINATKQGRYYPGRPSILIRKADGSTVKGFRGEGKSNHFKRGAYVTFKEDGFTNPSSVRTSSSRSEVEVASASDVVEMTEPHSLPPLSRGSSSACTPRVWEARSSLT